MLGVVRGGGGGGGGAGGLLLALVNTGNAKLDSDTLISLLRSFK
jgi:hypothetical protein